MLRHFVSYFYFFPRRIVLVMMEALSRALQIFSKCVRRRNWTYTMPGGRSFFSILSLNLFILDLHIYSGSDL